MPDPQPQQQQNDQPIKVYKGNRSILVQPNALMEANRKGWSATPPGTGFKAGFMHGLNPLAQPRFPDAARDKLGPLGMAKRLIAGPLAEPEASRAANIPEIKGRIKSKDYAGAAGEALGTGAQQLGLEGAARGLGAAKQVTQNVRGLGAATRGAEVASRAKALYEELRGLRGVEAGGAQLAEDATYAAHNALNKGFDTLRSVLGKESVKTGQVRQFARQLQDTGIRTLESLGDRLDHATRATPGAETVLTWDHADAFRREAIALMKKAPAQAKKILSGLTDTLNTGLEEVAKSKGLADADKHLREAWGLMHDVKVYIATGAKIPQSVLKRLTGLIGGAAVGETLGGHTFVGAYLGERSLARGKEAVVPPAEAKRAVEELIEKIPISLRPKTVTKVPIRRQVIRGAGAAERTLAPVPAHKQGEQE